MQRKQKGFFYAKFFKSKNKSIEKKEERRQGIKKIEKNEKRSFLKSKKARDLKLEKDSFLKEEIQKKMEIKNKFFLR